MGKMKEKFLEDQEKAIQDAMDAFMDDDYQLEEYYTSMKSEERRVIVKNVNVIVNQLHKKNPKQTMMHGGIV